MATALFAAIEGLSVLVLERSRWVGGTSALAAGAVWIPNTHLAEAAATRRRRRRGILAEACKAGSPALRKRFLDLGPAALQCLEAHTDVHMRAFTHHPDYLSELEGASTSGRVLECLPFDGRQLGDALSLVRPPIPEFTVLGGMMVDRIDIGHLTEHDDALSRLSCTPRGCCCTTAWTGCATGAARAWSWATRWSGVCCSSLRKRGVPVRTGMGAERLLTEDGRVTGIQVAWSRAQHALRARLGVVLAGGGFNDHPMLRQRLIPAEAKYSPRALSSPGLIAAAGAEPGRATGACCGQCGILGAGLGASARRRQPGGLSAFRARPRQAGDAW